jgi:branched-chain amino acid transport system permease protein
VLPPTSAGIGGGSGTAELAGADEVCRAVDVAPGVAEAEPDVVGAALLMSLPAALTYLPFLPPTELGSIQQIIYGLAMVLLMMFRPGGLVGGRSKEKSA